MHREKGKEKSRGNHKVFLRELLSPERGRIEGLNGEAQDVKHIMK